MIDRMGSFLHELRGNAAGNTLAIAAAALVPVVGMVGGAVDISRYYMATARMQNACDAGALAARKQMETDDFDAEDRAIGLRFFDQNYPEGTFGLENLNRDYDADDEGVVTGTATGDMPTTIMQIFGKSGMDIAVSCTAEINISNTDVMFVLDVTGSMAGGRIEGLRTAVVNFYDSVEAATSDSAQVRYGIVPYASNVNVGGSIPSEYIANRAVYQSRRAMWDHREFWELVSSEYISYKNAGAETSSGRTQLGYRNGQTEEWCQNKVPSNQSPTYIGPLSDVDIVSENDNGAVRNRIIEGRGQMQRGQGYYEYEPEYSYWNGRRWVTVDSRCRWGLEGRRFDADVRMSTREEWREDDQFTQWVFEERELDISELGGVGSSVSLPTGWSRPNSTYALANIYESHTWNGCIEEAQTVASATWDPVPEGAFDLNINLIPANDDQRWKPWLPSVVWKRQGVSGNGRANGTPTRNPAITHRLDDNDHRQPRANSGTYAASCPKAAMKLNPDLTRSQLVSYLAAAQGFVPDGYTYHDIGMIWGARFISPRGIFQSENETAPNGDSIARHIVYMTDGELNTQPNAVYSAYGVEFWDRRITNDGTKSSSDARVAARFQAACRQAREENISVWVVAFGTALTQNLIDCATPGRAYSAASSEDLNNAFQEIAQKIAALRLTS